MTSYSDKLSKTLPSNLALAALISQEWRSLSSQQLAAEISFLSLAKPKLVLVSVGVDEPT